jgi:uroporphyrinogen decarboxylase
MYEHRDADRVPIVDVPWESTVIRWWREGLPKGANWLDYFDIDQIAVLGVADIDTSPRCEARIIEETDTHRIEQDRWGAVKKNFKPISTTPQYLDFVIKDPDTWHEAKKRMAPTRDRVNWKRLQDHYTTWREKGAWVSVAPWFGYDIVNARMCGTDRILYAMAADPDWVVDMCNTQCNLALTLLDMIWDEGYTFDEFFWFDDMAYNKGMFFSKSMWHDMVKPYQQRTIDWAHAHGIKAHLHCCGNINALIPELIELGLDALNPMEVKAGMDPVYMKRTFGDKLLLRGGFDVRNWDDPAKVEADIRQVLPVMMESGGCIFSSDHSIPDSVSLENFRHIVNLVKEVGTY